MHDHGRKSTRKDAWLDQNKTQRSQTAHKIRPTYDGGKLQRLKKKSKEKKETAPYMCRKRFVLEQKLVPFGYAAAFGVRRDAGSPLLLSLLLSHCQQRTGGDGWDLLPPLQPAAPLLR